MTFFEAVILGIVQGLTEFLPISSTAHIVITSTLLNLQFPGLIMEIFLHLSSIVAVIYYFRKDLAEIITGFLAYIKRKDPVHRTSFQFGLYLIGATLITGVLGMILEDMISDALKSPSVIAAALALTGFFLIFIERFHTYGNKTEATMGWKDTIVVALAQTLAVIPGISRSGSTLIAALWTGLERKTAVRFSFLLSIPVILGSSVLLVTDLESGFVADVGIVPLVVAFLTSLVCSIIGIKWLIDFLNKSRLTYFAIYCFLLAGFVFFFLDKAAMLNI